MSLSTNNCSDVTDTTLDLNDPKKTEIQIKRLVCSLFDVCLKNSDRKTEEHNQDSTLYYQQCFNILLMWKKKQQSEIQANSGIVKQTILDHLIPECSYGAYILPSENNKSNILMLPLTKCACQKKCKGEDKNKCTNRKVIFGNVGSSVVIDEFNRQGLPHVNLVRQEILKIILSEIETMSISSQNEEIKSLVEDVNINSSKEDNLKRLNNIQELIIKEEGVKNGHLEKLIKKFDKPVFSQEGDINSFIDEKTNKQTDVDKNSFKYKKIKEELQSNIVKNIKNNKLKGKRLNENENIKKAIKDTYKIEIEKECKAINRFENNIDIHVENKVKFDLAIEELKKELPFIFYENMPYASLKRPDLMVVKEASKLPIPDTESEEGNIAFVIEIKFPGDSYGMGQEEFYRYLGGGKNPTLISALDCAEFFFENPDEVENCKKLKDELLNEKQEIEENYSLISTRINHVKGSCNELFYKLFNKYKNDKLNLADKAKKQVEIAKNELKKLKAENRTEEAIKKTTK